MNQSLIKLTDAPNIPGLRFRHFRGASDYPHIVAVMNASMTADNVEYCDSVEEVASAYENLLNCDPYQDVIFAEVNQDVIGYARCAWYSEAENGPCLYGSLGAIIPQWRRQGIGQALLNWLEQRLRDMAASHSKDRAKFFQVQTAHGQVALQAMLEQANYRPVRYSDEMLRPTLDAIPDFAMPEGLEVRPVLPEHYRLIWDAGNEASQDHWGFVTRTERDYQVWLNDKLFFHPDLWQIAWDIQSNQVAGQVRTFIDHAQNTKYDRQRGYTEFISVRRPWRRRGLARALIALSLKEQRKQGMTESALGVDSENLSGANRLYDACGFKVIKRHSTYRKPL